MPDSSAIRAGRAFVELFADDSQLQRKLRSVQARMRQFGADITSIGKRLSIGAGELPEPLAQVMGMLASPAGMLAGFGGAAKQFAEMGEAAQTMSQRTALSVESLSQLGYAARHTGADVETLERFVKSMQRNIVEAALTGSGPAHAMLVGMGLDAAALEKAAPDRMIDALADSLAQLRNPAERAAAVLTLGDRNATALLPLLSQGSAGIAKLRKEADALGLTMSSKDAEQAARLNSALGDLWQSVRMGVFAVGSALAPELTDLSKQIAQGSKAVADFVRENKGWILTAAKLSAVTVGVGASLTAMGLGLKLLDPLFVAARFGMSTFAKVGSTGLTVVSKAVSLLSMSVAKMGSIIVGTIAKAASGAFAALVGGAGGAAKAFMALLTPVGVIGFALVGIAGYALYMSGTIGKAVSEGKKFFATLSADATDAFEGLKAALSQGDIVSAAKLLWSLLKLEWEEGKAALNAVWIDSKRFFLDTWSSAVSSASGAFINMFYGLKTAWIETVAFLESSWATLADSLITLMRPVENWLAKQFAKMFARVHGLNENDVLNTLQADQQHAAAASGQKFAAQKAEIEAQRKKARTDNAANLTGALDENKAMATAQMQAHEDDQAKAIAGARANADAARAAFNAANAAAKKGHNKAAEEAIKRVGAGADLAKKTSSQTGTFNAFGLHGLAGGGPVQSIASNTKLQAQRQQKANQHLTVITGELLGIKRAIEKQSPLNWAP